MLAKNKSNQKLVIPNYKPEIDSLRGIAVFLVILFHFEILNITGGFIGVDVFFVISGYLITNLILIDLQHKKFSLSEFYLRRVRRILPALYSVIIFSLIVGYLVLSPVHLNRFGSSSSSSALGFSNFFVWYEDGYFDYNKLFKPLLHTWSLSVELQFYLFWPIFIVLIHKFFKKNIRIIILLVILLSLMFSIIYSYRATGFFYFTGLRLYEFAIGSFTYLVKDNFKFKFNDLLFFIGISLLILASLGFSKDTIFPGYNALIPCLITSLLLLVSNNLKFFKNLFINSFMIYMGKISYSLYLFHWPLLIFYTYITVQPLSFYEKISLILITILFSAFSYKFIELPFRRKENKKFTLSNKKLCFYFATSLFSILFISNLFTSNNGFESRLSVEKRTILQKLERENKEEQEKLTKGSVKIYFDNNESLIKTLIIGDSLGGNIYYALKKNKKFSSNLDIVHHTAPWAYYCYKKENNSDKIVRFINHNFLKNLKSKEKEMCNRKKDKTTLVDLMSSAEVIILSSRWTETMDFEKIINYIKESSSAKIIFMGRPPEFFDIPTLYFKFDKNLNYVAKIKKSPKVEVLNNKIKKITKILNVEYFDRTKLVCQTDDCTVIDGNKLLYLDSDHWSIDGEIFFGHRLYKYGLLNLIK